MLQIPSVIFPHYLPYYWTNKKGEFKLAYQVLRILYRQSLRWVRKFVRLKIHEICGFSTRFRVLACFQFATIGNPLMPFIGAISIVIFFWACHFALGACCTPEDRWTESKTSAFYLILTVITQAIVVFMVSIIMSR